MFKRVEKRRRKREEEEELGLDEDMKQVLGINDTDSEESASDSDGFGSDGAESSGNEEAQDLDEQDGLLEQFQFQEEESGEEAESPAITVQEALRDPVYIISLEPSVKGCIVCPGKTLKGAKMVELHVASNAHQRRVKQFAALASGVSSQTPAWDLLSQQEAIKSEKQSLDTPSDTSKRAQKRKSRAALRKMRRKKQKALAKAKKVAGMESSTASAEPPTTSPVTEPPKKKQKVDELISESISSAPPTVGPSQTSRERETKSVAAIARSASVRAQAARAKAKKGGAKSKPDRSSKTTS